MGRQSLIIILSRQIRLLLGILTHPIRVMPDFIIIGVQRGGTTSLYQYLTEHPNVAPALRKEVHFFNINFHKGIGWYKAHFPTLILMYWQKKLFKRHIITGEASAYYLVHPHVARRAFDTVPKAKIIVLLRNPVDRAWSSYHMQRLWRVEPLSFEDAIETEDERLHGEVQKMLDDERYYSFNHNRYSYLTRGIYIDHLKVWMDTFPREQILILRSEDLYSDPESTVDKVFRFLDLPSWKLREYKKYNYLSKKVMDPSTRRQLVEYFKPHNKRLYEYLGKDFDWDR